MSMVETYRTPIENLGDKNGSLMRGRQKLKICMTSSSGASKIHNSIIQTIKDDRPCLTVSPLTKQNILQYVRRIQNLNNYVCLC